MALTVTPTGALGLPLKHLRATIAASASFRTLVGAGDAAAALPSIAIAAADDVECFEDGTQNANFVAKPRAIIRWPDQADIAQFAQSTWSWGDGRLMIAFEFPENPSCKGNFQDGYMNFCNQLGAVLAEMYALANSGGYLAAKRYLIGPIGQAMSEENNGEEFWCAHVMAVFGGLA